ncbi:MAG: ABC transporter ATP-binding protein [Clostridium sp.]|nr:ABC transporter ATP-binding protein [Clostridium sp.]MDY3829298.1 ABC transporter ATP-binding protein [Clostridium sp.]
MEILKMKDVSLLYDADKDEKTYAVRQANLSLEEGKFYGILGPSGSGKSSLLYLLSGIKPPTVGSIYYKNKDITKMNDSELSKIRLEEFGFIFQKHYLIPYLNIIQNVLVPLNSNKKEDVDRAINLLTELGLEKKLNKKPYELSGGQCQRVAIARALINNPKIIFADEITASLDHKNSKEIVDKLNKLRGNTTIIFVTHDETTVQNADEIIKVWDGEIRRG